MLRNPSSTLDAVLDAGVLRRGLILGCSDCAQKQFVSVDLLAQRWTCTRCDARSSLDHRAWHLPEMEPLWFYDLHPAGRQLIKENGDVCALAAAHLGRRAAAAGRNTQSTEEINFQRAGKKLYEIDMVVYDARTLSVVECKSNGSLTTGAQNARDVVEKRCLAAALLEADEVVFATSAPSWNDSVRADIAATMDAFDGWPVRGRPTARLISNLGSLGYDAVREQLI